MTIWINEQLDPSGMIHACIASCDEMTAQECYKSFEENLTPEQKSQGWIVQMRTVESWDDVPVNSLKLN